VSSGDRRVSDPSPPRKAAATKPSVGAASGSTSLPESPFPSFFMGGFESSTPVLSDGRRLDLVVASQHDTQAAADYDLLLGAGVRTIRESVRWPMVDRGGRLYLSGIKRMAALLRERGMLAIWDLLHYGFPDGVDPYSAAFVDRFARYARGVATVLASEQAGPGWYTPINEISFMSHAAGDIGLFQPFSRGRGYEIKLQLIRASVAAMEAIRDVDPRAGFVQVDPLIHLVPARPGDDEAARVRDFNERIVFEGWHMLQGTVEPGLGGRPDFLTVAGMNVYRLCQWELENEGSFLGTDDPRWTPINVMLADAWARLGVPLIIGETGELGPNRAGWLRYLLGEVEVARNAGVPVLGVCWYPIVSTPDWQDPTTLFAGGWWDSVPRGNRLVRVPYEPVLEIAAAERRRLGELEQDDADARGDVPPLPEADATPPELRTSHPPLELSQTRRRRLPESWERALVAQGDEMAVSVYTFAPGRSVGVRAFPSSETVLSVVEGSVIVTGWTDGQHLTAGSVTLIPKGRAFGVYNPGPKAATVMQVTSPPAWNADLQRPERRGPERRPRIARSVLTPETTTDPG
jgi:mannose-6-phosphate isomerase-like protein (cupin superfamily)